jgi:hypothetical protein
MPEQAGTGTGFPDRTFAVFGWSFLSPTASILIITVVRRRIATFSGTQRHIEPCHVDELGLAVKVRVGVFQLEPFATSLDGADASNITAQVLRRRHRSCFISIEVQ